MKENTVVSIRYGACLLKNRYEDVKDSLLRLGYIEKDGDGLALTEKGRDRKMRYLSDDIPGLSKEVLDDVGKDMRCVLSAYAGS